ncbi:MAG: deoxyribose-phosphate aldolase [Bdellovibrionales bacterium]|nr:deoxyribose-phosphate aldolase [Bdellovibrionales bacterium]
MENVKQKIDKIKTQIEKYFTVQLPSTAISPVNTAKIEQVIDHTLLSPAATSKDIERVCDEAISYQFYSVCVPPRFVSLARKRLGASSIHVATVIGFPLGYNKSSIKRLETLKAIENGASEIDMVLPIGALISENWSVVRKDIQTVVEGASQVPVKVILETGFLTEEQIIAGCFISQLSKARFVKTSTGFGPRGASVTDIETMHHTIGGQLGIKASGGIKTIEDAQAMIQAGATRIGTSNSIIILQQYHEQRSKLH